MFANFKQREGIIVMGVGIFVVLFVCVRKCMCKYASRS